MSDNSNNSGNASSGNTASGQGQTTTPTPTPQVERPTTNTFIQTHSANDSDYQTKKKGHQ